VGGAYLNWVEYRRLGVGYGLMRILAFSDIHGYTEAVRRLVSEVSKEKFDCIVFAGDFTNAWFDGLKEGRKQMGEITSLIESLGKPFYFIYGNRDFYPPFGKVECQIGKNINSEDYPIGDYTLTNKIKALDSSKILVTHSLHPSLKSTQSKSLAYLYGHDHVGRIYKNYVDLGFLYRGRKAHGAIESLFGCYWFVDVDNGKTQFENHSWQMKEAVCHPHKDQGTFYIPYYWKKCSFCYDENEYRLNF